MKAPTLPLTRDVVLIGGGHTHALVLRKWGMRLLPGARLTVIDPNPAAAYSGMLPGHVAGHYTRDDLDIDLVRLARFAGARLIPGAADGIDPETRTVHVPGRPPVGYDLCSVDIGITSDMPALPGFSDHGVPAKPLGQFARKWQAFLSRGSSEPVAVIGAGVAGAELAMAMACALRHSGRPGGVTLIDSSGALPGVSARAEARLRAEIAAQGVTLLENTPVARLEAGAVVLGDGRSIPAGFIAGAAGAKPHGWLAQTGLDLTDGYITVDADLRSSDPAIFAAGDCAHLATSPRPKAGVFAVREAPVLFDNLRAALTGGRLRPYRPQGDYLKLISLGGKRALADRFGMAPTGALMWRWKNRIDRTFMEKFRDLPAMKTPPLPAERALDVEATLGDKPMCGGCGAKVGRDTLRGVLGPGTEDRRADITPLPGDDAALLRTGGVDQVISSDHLRAFTEDPVAMTRIAAVHALGDIWAMGGAPQAATATLILPRQSEPLQARMLAEIMTTAREVMTAAGAAIVGGHTSLGDELTVGFTVTGLCDRPPITLAGGRAGDALILTKPLGSGVLLAAEMQMQARGAWVAAALVQMAQPQGAASAILAAAHAMTDVTGFGLAGHLLNICEASGTGARLNPEAVPLMEGALELAEAGIRSTLFPQNRAQAPFLPEAPRIDLLFDPQTAGGLLAAVPAEEADRLVARLREAGYPAARIGALTGGPGGIVLEDGVPHHLSRRGETPRIRSGVTGGQP